ncbi:unnamed protein product [Effrenium voratum]|uniref:Integrase catalytic domain-containing protein n=1 Tax=Effrenium voratum TaxID=2562239 RepID=A0AA36N4Q0_9DINO|nr:unnamed protein product [Effrenium voratum]
MLELWKDGPQIKRLLGPAEHQPGRRRLDVCPGYTIFIGNYRRCNGFRRSAKLSEPAAGSASVRMIRLVTPPDMDETRMSDLTAGEDEFLGMIQEVEDESYAVLMVEREDDESFFDAHEPAVEEIGQATVMAMDLQGDNFETEDETYQVNMVMDEEMDHGGIIMKDAQGNIIQQSGMRKVNFAMMGKDGNFVEKFIVGKVKHPILCAGRLLRSGWEMRRSGDLNLWHKQGVEIPLEMKKNSLQVVAEICSVETENNEHEEEWNTVEVCVLEGFLYASFKELEKISGTFDWKARMTFMKTKDGKWMQVENVTTISVVAPVKMKGYFKVDSEVPVARAAIRCHEEEAAAEEHAGHRKEVEIVRPSLEQQNEHNLTHYPFAGWCQACLSTRAKEEVHKRDVKKDVESSKTVISFDFGYTYVDDYGNEKSPDKVKDADEQYGAVLYIADHHTKAVHAVPVMSKGAHNLKLMVEELVRFGMQVAGGDPVIYQSDGERYYAEEQAQVTVLGSSHVYPWSFRHASWLINRYLLEKERKTSYEVWSGRKYQGKICLFGESVMYRLHIVLTPGRIGTDLVIVKGLPWNYSASGVLMKKVGPRRRIAAAADAAEEDEKAELDNTEGTKDIAKKADVKIGNYKKTPARSDLGKRDGSAELSEAETSEFRSIVGKMLYIGGERPDCQFAINALAAWMSKPTKTAWRHAEHLASYLVGAEFYRLLIKSSRCGKSMLDMREMQEIEVKKVHLMEVVADSDYAGDQNSRKSITSFQVFLDGNQKPEKHLTFKR